MKFLARLCEAVLAEMFLALMGLDRSAPADTRTSRIDGRLPAQLRRRPLGRVELVPTADAVSALIGRPITTARIVRPGDSGPVIVCIRLDIRPDSWADATPEALQRLARDLRIDDLELERAVTVLCGGR